MLYILPLAFWGIEPPRMSAGGALERAPQAPERQSMADDVVQAAEGALGAVEVGTEC